MTTTLQTQLQDALRGEVRFDRLTRTLYATDASIYEIVPTGVVLPADEGDVVAAVDICRTCGVPVIARGGGTGLAGGAVGSGVQVDCSRYLTRISDFDPRRRTVRVQAGVVLDELNTFLASHGLHFAPDVATSSRATIGGMIAGNSCGAHSIIYGRTVDHVAGLTAVLSDGSVAKWSGHQAGDQGSAERIETELARIAEAYRDEVQARFPRVLRRNGGYALDRICGVIFPGDVAPRRPRTDQAGPQPVNPATIVCGSEGTLALVTEAVLQLTPLPKCKALLVVHFADVLEALRATPTILEYGPAAVELIDRMIVNAATRNGTRPRRFDFLATEAGALLIVELFDDAEQALSRRIDELEARLSREGIGYARRIITDPRRQADVWDMRKSGLGLLMSRPGDVQPHAFVEDAAVAPERLSDFIERFGGILAEEGIRDVGYYAHASVGLIHVRPALNLKSADDITRMKRIADRVSDLTLEFGGAMSGEHGDGIVRSCWLEKMYGPRIVQAFREVKQAFDPIGLFNPGKIIDPLPMTENLRYGPEFAQREVKTRLDFTAHGGMAGLAQMCSGVGQCRQRLVGTMCPSYMATGDETHTTRARANALRVALSNRGLLRGLDDPALEEVMDLCLLCKACKTECPTGVDMARLKVEWLAHHNLRQGATRGARFIADSSKWARRGSWFPRLTNIMLQSRMIRAVLERRYGLDRRIPPPRFASQTFHRAFARRKRYSRGPGPDAPSVVYLVDTWTNHYAPQVGFAAVALLEAAGYKVLVPRIECCGRPLISKGLLAEAKLLAEENVEQLARFADTQTPIVGTEPSCILTFTDEYPQLVPTDDARAVAALARTCEAFLADILRKDPDRIGFTDRRRRLLYHAHCYQKALVGSRDALWLLNRPPGYSADEINSGCCGMAGAFGHEKAHYDVSARIGEQRLFPAVRARGSAAIAVSGFSCREQIAHHTDAVPRHVVELLADALPDR